MRVLMVAFARARARAERRGPVMTVARQDSPAGLLRAAPAGISSWAIPDKRLRGLVAVMVVTGSLVATGCGGTTEQSSRPSTTTVLSAATSAAGRTTTTTHRQSPRHRRAHNPSRSPHGHGARPFIPPTRTQRVLLAVSSACAFARIGAPVAPVRSAKPESWRRYAAAAHAFALRTSSALRKVPTRRVRLPELHRLISAYNDLAQVYASDGADASASRTIASSEQRTAAVALAARLPACAPAALRPLTGIKG